MTWAPINSSADLAALIERHSAATAVAVDTEFMRRDTFYPQAALIQLCFEGDDCAFLIDPLAVDDFAPLQMLFRNSSILKVLHSPGEDLEVFQRLLGVLPEPLFDTQRAAGFLDMGHGLGYRALVEQLTGEQLPKGETRSDWLQRPLSDSQLEYAAQDVIPLQGLYLTLWKQLESSNKLEWVLEDGATMLLEAGSDQYRPVERFKSAWKLNSAQLAVLMQVSDWREQRARELDKPRGWILSDPHCLELAKRLPSTKTELSQIDAFPDSVVRKQGDTLLGMVADVRARPAGDLPSRLASPLTRDQQSLLKELKKSARAMAANWAIAPELVLASKDYERLVRFIGGDPVTEPASWSGWRRENLLEPLLAGYGASF